jgi:hypothetical protein
VDIDRNGKVYNVLNDLVPEPKIEKARRTEISGIAKGLLSRAQPGALLTQAEAEQRALAEAGGKAAGAETLKTEDTSLEDDSKLPDAAYVDVVLRDLKPGGRLDGPFVSTKRTPNRVRRTNRKFTFFRSDRAFKEVMVYFHIDTAQRYIQDLGFDNILNRPVEVHIDGRRDDQSQSSPTTKALTFGVGGVDDAEDAEIILHEYGHAIQDDQVPGWGESPEAGAMGDGFGILPKPKRNCRQK